jgi:FtsZ-binding cell division protein ZapB
LNECSIDTWAALLMLAIDEIATEENNKKVAKDALSGTQKVLRMHPEKLDENIKVWLEDMFKGVYLF